MITVRELESAIRKAISTGTKSKFTDTDRRGQGTLQIRILENGNTIFYYRHVTSNGKRDDLSIGRYDPSGIKGLTLEMARNKYGEYAGYYRQGIKEVRQYLEEQERARAGALRASEDQTKKLLAGNLESLMHAYVNYLKDNVKPSCKDVENIFKNHVLCFPDLVARCANTLGPRDLRPIFDRMHELGLTRALGKTRSALHSAFSLAARAEFDSTIPRAFRTFDVGANPVASLPTYSTLSQPGDRVLSHDELRVLMRNLRELNGLVAKAILIALYLGGQRPTQLLRVVATDVDWDRSQITLRDGKGRRAHPRLHVLPILEPVTTWIQECLMVNRIAPSLFSTDGKTVPHTTTLSKVVHDISQGAYRMGDIRRTCETELAALGISKDLRGQILSHELGGIQAKHYDRHQYLAEKVNALTLWKDHLESL